MTALDGLLPFARSGTARPRRGWRQGWQALGRLRRAIVTRHHLLEMDDRMLADIGISRLDALAEAGRVPWDTAPQHREVDDPR